MTARHRTIWLALLALTLSARVGYVLLYPQMPVADDAAWYDEEASHLAVGNTARTPLFTRGPVYSVFLASVYRLAGHDRPAARFAQALVSCMAALVLYALARVVFNAHVGLLAFGLAALYPPFIVYPGWLLTETLCVLLLLVFVYSLVRAWQRSVPTRWMLAGLLGGLTALLRSELLLVVVLAGLAACVRPVRLGRLAAYSLAVAAVLIPWALRNYRQTGAWTLAAAPGAGHVLWISTVEIRGPEWDPAAPYMAEYRALASGVDPLEADRRLRRRALERIRANPAAYARLCLKRIPAFWLGGHSSSVRHLDGSLGAYLRERAYGRAAVKLAMLAYNLALLGLGIWGMCLAGLAHRPAVFLVIPVAVKAMIHVCLFAALRYQVPVMAFLIVFAAVALSRIKRAAAITA